MKGQEVVRAKRASGEGSIWKDPKTGRFQGQIVIGDRRRKVHGGTKTEVSGKLRELKRAAEKGLDPAPKTLTVEKFLNGWLDEVLPGTVAASTERNYRDIARISIIPNVGSKHLVTLKPSDVTAMMNALRDKGRKPNTVRLARAVLRRALRSAEVEGLVQRNVAAIAEGPHVGNPAKKAMELHQIEKFYAAIADHRFRTLWRLGITSGARPGELLGLEWSDIDFERGTIRIRQTLKKDGLGEPKTRKSKRTVGIPPDAVESLKGHRERQKIEKVEWGKKVARLHAVGEGATLGPWEELPLGADLVFRSERGAALHYRVPAKQLAKATDAAGIGNKWTPHELRHTAVSLMVHQGVSLQDVSATIGHSSISETADVYLHLFKRARGATASALEGLFAEEPG